MEIHNEIIDALKKATEEHDKQMLKTINELLDKDGIADDKEVCVVEIILTRYDYDEYKVERKTLYTICETEETAERFVKSIQNIQTEIKVYKGISKNKIKNIKS